MCCRIRIQSVLLEPHNGGLQLVLGVDVRDRALAYETARKAREGLKKGKQYDIDIDYVKNRRSIDANAYFHVLVDKIAKVTHQSNEDVKESLVLSYGAIEKTESGEDAIFKVPKNIDLYRFWKYFDVIGEDDDGMQVIFYKATHTMTTAEMSRLIEGTVADAQLLGIETATPEQIQKMTAIYAEKFN